MLTNDKYALMGVIEKRFMFYRIIRLRHRYFLTRRNTLRLRYVVGSAATISMVLVSFLGAMSSSIAFAPTHHLGLADAVVVAPSIERQLASIAPSAPQTLIPQNKAYNDENLTAHNVLDLIEPLLLPEGRKRQGGMSPSPNLSFVPSRENMITIKSGDTIAGVLQSLGVSGVDSYRAVKAMSKAYDLRAVKPGQEISVHLSPYDEDKDTVTLMGLKVKISTIKTLVLSKDTQDRFSVYMDEKPVFRQKKAIKMSIETSIYGSAARAGLPAAIVADMIRLYSYETDFQRDVRRGDTIEILYETYETEEGEFMRYGHVLYTNLTVAGKALPLYRYEKEDGSVSYYRKNGHGLKRALMQTPVDGARISSGFGMRHHPVLGYNKMHKGIDFAAPRGTPVYAAGKGVIERAGRNGGYGNYVRIRHRNGLKTAYAHMHKFAKNVKPGQHVTQGQVIGYVGTSGRSTGPHLHFEVLKNGKQINPKHVQSSVEDKLDAQDLKNFQANVSALQTQYTHVLGDLKLAENSISK